MRQVQAPEECAEQGTTVFLAGGISDTENWQAVVIAQLRNTPGVIANPRREEYEPSDAVGREQIAWEYRHLQRAGLVAFWFPPETLCPIALFELGACCSSRVPLIVGAHPGYRRRFDLVEQLSLRRPEVQLIDSLDEFVCQIHAYQVLQGEMR
ncbi:nucleoside 2-deoxyribosyltransferase domain-containing protein [Anatilimnocola floriformis]|uniref:nucleoside 2-deoxyribosyltransferase domain-containing protein n=1 Tax=Anatilimnocola floriformis TaxID=2948575 RepID=UPI0020C3A0EE|nr:nucleoside 2-deoxyribosyltransferase domain-containing protein [Anatilimnocola floriformis]